MIGTKTLALTALALAGAIAALRLGLFARLDARDAGTLVFAGAFGAVGAVTQAVRAPSSETTRSRRAAAVRRMGILR